MYLFHQQNHAIHTAGNDCNSVFHWSLIQTAPDGTPLANLQPVVDTQGPDSSLTLTLPEAKTRYSLLVRQIDVDASSSGFVGGYGSSGDGGSDGVIVIAEQRKDVYVKYVRRELRDLTEEDRGVYFSTMAEFYGVSVREGKEKYGTAFGNSDLMAAYHNSRVRCWMAVVFATASRAGCRVSGFVVVVVVAPFPSYFEVFPFSSNPFHALLLTRICCFFSVPILSVSTPWPSFTRCHCPHCCVRSQTYISVPLLSHCGMASPELLLSQRNALPERARCVRPMGRAVDADD